MPRATQPLIHESSGMRSVRDADAVPKQWTRTNNANTGNAAVNTALERMQRQINQARRRILGMPQTPATTFTDYYPFKIYLPPGPQYINSTPQLGTIFNSPAFKRPSTLIRQCRQISPAHRQRSIHSTDGWRFIAVRSGYVYYRNYFSSTISGGGASIASYNYADATIVEQGTDWIQPGTGSGLYQFDTQTSVSLANNNFAFPSLSGAPVIMDGVVDLNGQFLYLLYLEIIPDGGTGIGGVGGFLASVKGRRISTASGAGYANPIMPGFSPYIIPIGVVSVLGGGSVIDIDQIQYGHVALQYGGGMFDANNPNTPVSTDFICGPMLYRGIWTGGSISSQIFYPGDVVQVTENINFGGSVGNRTNYTLWMQRNVGFTSDPTTDPSWFQVTGLSL